MNKQELISQLNNIQNNFMLGLAALGLLLREDSFSVLESLLCVLTDSSISFISDTSQIHEQFKGVQFPLKVAPYPLAEAAKYIKDSDKRQRENIQREFFMMLLEVLLKESFEVIKNYCQNSNKLHLFKQQDWYDFARIVRNCLSHNFLVEYKNNQEKKKITHLLEGKELYSRYGWQASSNKLFWYRWST
ncbi:MAG: hypothetical protein HC936_01500 [Leptolyngbyaceae cyanobacterium SU_3_3]|nr:hypothetical protein [Leptolyngbyaceae cyanobacterium SU_3_3]